MAIFLLFGFNDHNFLRNATQRLLESTCILCNFVRLFSLTQCFSSLAHIKKTLFFNKWTFPLVIGVTCS